MLEHYFKTGGDFQFELQLTDANTDSPVHINELIEIRSSVGVEVLGVLKNITPCTVELLANPGSFKLIVPALVTSKWPAGIGKIDIKVSVGGVPILSDTFSFDVEKGITP
jgi:hypothetical protein